MKLAVVILAVVAVASPLYAYELPSVGSGALAKELQDFIDVVPIDELIAVTKTYATQDKEFQAAMKVLQSPEVKLYIGDVEAAPEVKKLMKYMQNAGLDIIKIVNTFNKAYGLSPVAPLDVSEPKIVGGINGFRREVLNLIPIENIRELYKSKIAETNPFSDFIYEVSEPENLEFYSKLHLNPHFVQAVKEAAKSGVDADDFENAAGILIGAKVLLSLH